MPPRKKPPAKKKRAKRGAERPSPAPKLQRWIDLLAALLAHRMPVSFAELRSEVPGYSAGAGAATCERMFERDKDELRTFGVPIETRKGKGEEEKDAYRLRHDDFYLPFIQVVASGQSARPRIGPEGYRSLATLSFEPDELEAVASAAARVRSLGDPMLGADAESAMRKLAFDLPVDAAQPGGNGERIVAERVDAKIFAKLGAALLQRKIVSFKYLTMQTGKTTARGAEPYGLVFLGAHWYLVARDRGKEEMRNFRLSRMSEVDVNKKRAGSADYGIPGTFHLDAESRSREAWSLGDEEEIQVTVDFRGDTGAVRAAAKLGTPVRGGAGKRQFRVRRPDHFARWLLSFGGDAMPVEPKGFVTKFRALARETLAAAEAAS
jgi:predicted DNA-binding transcriptional regulator YafY